MHGGVLVSIDDMSLGVIMNNVVSIKHNVWIKW